MKDRKMNQNRPENARPDAVTNGGNNEWFASGAGLDDEPFERTWKGPRPDWDDSRAGEAASTGAPLHERRSMTRRDIAHDPFVRLIGEDRRINGGDRRSSSRGSGPTSGSRNRPSRLL